MQSSQAVKLQHLVGGLPSTYKTEHILCLLLTGYVPAATFPQRRAFRISLHLAGMSITYTCMPSVLLTALGNLCCQRKMIQLSPSLGLYGGDRRSSTAQSVTGVNSWMLPPLVGYSTAGGSPSCMPCGTPNVETSLNLSTLVVQYHTECSSDLPPCRMLAQEMLMLTPMLIRSPETPMRLPGETAITWPARACMHMIRLRKGVHMHSLVNAEPGTPPPHINILGGLRPIKGANMHAADQNPAACAAATLNLSVPHALPDC